MRPHAPAIALTDVHQANSDRDWRDIEQLSGRDLDRNGWVLLARQGCVAVGFVELAQRDEFTAELQSFVLRPLARGSGVGMQLIRSAMDAVASQGYRDLLMGAAAAIAV
jgi:GNAT superfamily N-acetyltransferase